MDGLFVMARTVLQTLETSLSSVLAIHILLDKSVGLPAQPSRQISCHHTHTLPLQVQSGSHYHSYDYHGH